MREMNEKLRAVPLFADLDEPALARIGSVSTEIEVPAGQVLIERGQAGSGMFVLEQGSVEVELPDGRTIEQGPGAFLGELALLTDNARTARVKAVSPVRCLAIGRHEFSNLVEEEPRIAAVMLPVLARRLADLIT